MSMEFTLGPVWEGPGGHQSRHHAAGTLRGECLQTGSGARCKGRRPRPRHSFSLSAKSALAASRMHFSPANCIKNALAMRFFHVPPLTYCAHTARFPNEPLTNYCIFFDSAETGKNGSQGQLSRRTRLAQTLNLCKRLFCKLSGTLLLSMSRAGGRALTLILKAGFGTAIFTPQQEVTGAEIIFGCWVY